MRLKATELRQATDKATTNTAGRILILKSVDYKGLWFSIVLKRVYDGHVSGISRGILRKPASLFAFKAAYA